MKPYASYKPSGVAWLGDVPAHWEVKQARFVMTCNDDVLPESTSPGQVLDYIEISDVDEVSGIKGFESVKFSDAPSRARRLVMDGDVIVSTVRTYLRAVAAISNPTAETVVSTGFAVLRPRAIDSRYSKYAILYDGFISEVISRSKGISYPAINATDLVRISVPLPPPDEQQAIADYLDAETARIDMLVQEKEELIGLLKEARSATITEAVSRGLCPSVPLKSSGLHFLGNVPKHWKKFKVAHAFGTSSGTTPPTDEPKWYEGDVPWVQSSELRENVVFSTEKKVTVEAVQKFSALKIYPAGTLLLAMYGATIGRVGLLGVPATTNQACCALHPLGEISTQFFCWWLQAYRDELVARGYGGGQPNISATLISGMYFFAPLPEEQQAIADYLDDETAKIDALITHTQEEIALLKELRAATIADAVLGRVDVRSLTQKQ